MGATKHSVARGILERLIDRNTRQTSHYMKTIDAFSESLIHGTSYAEQSSNPQSAPIKVIDLFCGCGGASAGFLSINKTLPVFQVVSAWDIDPDACSTYSQLGFKPTCGDIRTISGDRRILNGLKRKIGDGNASILIGCPPCQGFSAHTKVNLGAGEDERNSLVDEFTRISAELEPDYVFMENVPELLSGKYREHFKFFKDEMVSKGYHVGAAIVNMAEFGLPQARKRAVVLASRDPVSMPRSILLPEEFVTVRHAIAHLPRISAGIPDPDDPLHVTANHRSTTLDVIKAIPKDGGSRPLGLGPKCLDRVRGFSDVYGRMRWNRPSVTITGSARNPASGRFVHPDQDRGLSIREAMILQGFPASFCLEGSFDKKFSLVGNAVPPLFAAAVAAHLVFEMTRWPENYLESIHHSKPELPGLTSTVKIPIDQRQCRRSRNCLVHT